MSQEEGFVSSVREDGTARQKDPKGREGVVFTHGCVTPPVSGDLQERCCFSPSHACSVSVLQSFFVS